MTNEREEKTYALFSSRTNKKIASELKKNNLKFFEFPPAEIAKTDLSETQIEYLRAPTNFDWIIFPDVFAVDCFLQRLEELEFDVFELDLVKVCAFGEAVSDRLRFSQLHADVISAEISEDAAVSALVDYLSGEEFENLKFLLVYNSDREFSLKKMLIEKRAQVFELPVYKTVESKTEDLAKLKTLLFGGAFDEFIFSAAEDFFALQIYAKNFSLKEILSETKVSVTNENAFLTAKEFGLRPLYFHL